MAHDAQRPAWPKVSEDGAAHVALMNLLSGELQGLGLGTFNAAFEYETVAASQTAQVLGATGAAGDYIERLLIVPATTSPGNVLLLDDATSITVFAGGASSVADLKPIEVRIGARSVNGAWKVTTGANVSVIAVGSFE